MFNKISPQDKVDFAKNLAVMLKSGIPINEALESIGEQTGSKYFSKVINKLKNEIEKGTSLSQAFSDEEQVFGKVFTSLIRAGEASGSLEENLSFLADWLESNNDLREQVNTATLYPKIILVATILLGGSLTVLILPRLIPLFRSLKVELPLPTKIMMAFSLFIQQYWLFVLIFLVGMVITFNLLNRIKPIKRWFHLIYLRMPFFGKLMIDYQLALMCQLFFVLSKSGLSINSLLDVTGEAATNIHYQDSIKAIQGRVDKGTTLSEGMTHYPKLYPRNLISIIAIGEKSGTIDNSFLYLKDYYSKEVSNRTKKIPIIIEPALLIVIGIAIGFVAVSIILPIYELTQGLR